MSTGDVDRLFETYAQPLYAFLFYRVGDHPLAEDLVSETFERVLRSRRRYNPRRGSERTWIYTIALNLLRDRARRTGAEQRAMERSAAIPVSSGITGVEAMEEHAAVAAAIANLPERERELIALRYGADLTMPEIARATGQKLTTVESRVSSALRRLREELE